MSKLPKSEKEELAEEFAEAFFTNPDLDDYLNLYGCDALSKAELMERLGVIVGQSMRTARNRILAKSSKEERDAFLGEFLRTAEVAV